MTARNHTLQKNEAIQWISLLALVSILAAGCATDSGHVSAKNFQRRYDASRTQMMEHYSYAGETNGYVYITRIRLPRFYYSKLKSQTCFTEINNLAPDFLQDVRNHQMQP